MTATPPHGPDQAIQRLQDTLTGALADIASELVLMNNHLERIELALRSLGSKSDSA